MYLDNIKFSPATKINFIQRKWYDRYIFKVVVEVDRSELEVSKRTSSNLFWQWNRSHYSNSASLLAVMRSDISQMLALGDYRMRSEGITVSVFTNEEYHVRELVKHYGSRIKTVDKPISDEHVAVIENHKKVVVRKTLFENRFRFKIYLKYDWDQRTDRYQAVQDFLESFENYSVNSSLKHFFYSDISPRRIGSTVAVYFSDPEDLMMFQLKFNNDILKIEEAVLLSDL